MWSTAPSAPKLVQSRRPFLLAAFTLFAALAALAAVTLLARRTFDRLQRGSDARQEAYDVLSALRKVRQDVGEMRVGITGFVSTRDSLYVRTYRSGAKGLASDTTILRRLTLRAPTLQAQLDSLQPELVGYGAELASTLHAAQSPASSREHPVLTRSGMLIEDMRRRFVAIETEQLRLLSEGTSEVKQAVARTNTVFTWVLVAGVVLISGTALLLFIYLRTRARGESRLALAQEQLHESRRLEAVGRLAGGVAHDFNNMLTVITGLCDLMHESVSDDDPLQPDIALMRDAAQRGTRLTRQLLAFGRRQVLELRVLDLNDVVRHFRSLLDRVIPEDIAVSVLLADGLGRVRADAGQLEQILMNLAVNARDAMTSGGRLTIETANAEIDSAASSLRDEVVPGRYVVLVVSDTGMGMDEATRERVFEPFFTTKEFGVGTGLGLATVYGIVKQCGGHVWVYSEPSHGATFKVYLPRVDEAATAEHAELLVASSRMTGSETILLVEDDESVREVTNRILSGAGYQVLSARDPVAALQLLSLHPQPIQMLLSDVVLPGMSGPQLAREVLARAPHVHVLFQSGYSEAAIAQHGALEGGAPLLHKPFTALALLTKVRATLDSQ